MKTTSFKISIRPILIIVVAGFVLITLTGCGIGHRPYRNYHNNSGYHSNNNGQDYKGSNASNYNSNNSGNGPMMRYRSGQSGYCGR